MKISVVIPCYNSEKSIAEVVDLTKGELLKLGYEYEFVLVNDYSKDNTFNEIKVLCEQDSNIKGINLAKNFGQHKAIAAGIKYITGDLIMFMDDDLQTHPSQISLLINKLNEGNDVVFAYYEGKKHSFIRNLGSKFTLYTTRLLSQTPKDFKMSSFWVAKRYIIDEFNKYQGPFPSMIRVLLNTTNSFGFVKVKHFDRVYGKSNYSFKALVKLWTSILDSSVVPLRIATYLGLISSIVGFILACTVIIRRVLNPEVVAGWSSIMALMIMLSGLIFFILGIMGEYIGKMYLILTNHQNYVIKEKININ